MPYPQRHVRALLPVDLLDENLTPSIGSMQRQWCRGRPASLHHSASRISPIATSKAATSQKACASLALRGHLTWLRLSQTEPGPLRRRCRSLRS
jgi:hypothetical protein